MDYQICMQRCWMCHRRNSAKIASKFVAKKGVYSMVAIRRMHNQVQRYYERAKRNEPVCLFVYSLEITNQASFSLQHPWGDDHSKSTSFSNRAVSSRNVLFRVKQLTKSRLFHVSLHILCTRTCCFLLAASIIIMSHALIREAQRALFASKVPYHPLCLYLVIHIDIGIYSHQ